MFTECYVLSYSKHNR